MAVKVENSFCLI